MIALLLCGLSTHDSIAQEASPKSAPPPPIDELTEALDDLRIVGRPLPEAARSYAVGHLSLDFGGGEVYLVRAADRTVGAFFHGDGSFTYQSESAHERELFPLNVDRVTGMKVKDGVMSEDLDSALVLDPAIQDRLAEGTEALVGPEEDETEEDETLQAAREALSKHLDRFADDRAAPTARIAQAIAEGAGEAVAAVQIHAGDDLVYLHDALRRGEETLAVMDRFNRYHPLSGQRFPQGLSVQPLGEPLARWPIRFVLSHVDLELVNPEERSMTLEVRETFEIRKPLRTLELELWSDRVTADGVFAYDLDAVTDADGDPLPYARRLDELVVGLPGGARPGEEVQVRFRLSGDVLNRPGGHSFWWLPIAPWMPRPGRLDMAAFTYHAVVKAADPFLPFSMGHEVRRWEEDGLHCVETELDRPVQFAVILAGKYHTYTEERDGFPITLASYAFSHDESMRKIANNLFQIKKLYEVLLGEFPFDELHVIEINEYGFGVAPPGVIYLTREAFDPSPKGRAFREELNLRMAHEMAHMYWGHVAQMSSYDEQWLSESTAEYYGAVAVGQFLGEREFRQAYRNWKEQRSLIDDASSIYLANRIAGEKAGRERYGLLYAQGPLMLHELREELGDKTFFTLFKSFLTNFRFQPVETKTFFELTEYITRKDYRPWFRERLFGLE